METLELKPEILTSPLTTDLPVFNKQQANHFKPKKTFLVIAGIVVLVVCLMVIGIIIASVKSASHVQSVPQASRLSFLIQSDKQNQANVSLVSRFIALISPFSSPTPTPTPTLAPVPKPTASPISTTLGSTPKPRTASTPTPTPTSTPTPNPSPSPTPNATAQPETGLANGAENTTTLSSKVLVIGYNPTENGVSLTDQYYTNSQYPNSSAIESSVFNNTVTAFSNLSHGAIQFSIVKTLHINTFQAYPDGFSYSLSSFGVCTNSATAGQCETRKWQFDYVKWATENNICQIASDAGVDEIWLLSPPYIMTYEAFMIGPNSGFDVNGANFTVPGCSKHYIVMNGTYDRPENMLHDIGHRVEATMRYLTQSWKSDDVQNDWEQFVALKLYNGQTPSGAYCGNAHYPSNTSTSYDYSNGASKVSNCNNWQNFPDFTGTTQTISCSTWGCSDSGWQQYWLSFVPHFTGKVLMTNGVGKQFYFLKNWWQYFLYPENAISAKKIM